MGGAPAEELMVRHHGTSLGVVGDRRGKFSVVSFKFTVLEKRKARREERGVRGEEKKDFDLRGQEPTLCKPRKGWGTLKSGGAGSLFCAGTGGAWTALMARNDGFVSGLGGAGFVLVLLVMVRPDPLESGFVIGGGRLRVLGRENRGRGHSAQKECTAKREK
jgi:hypothetical protein